LASGREWQHGKNNESRVQTRHGLLGVDCQRKTSENGAIRPFLAFFTPGKEIQLS